MGTISSTERRSSDSEVVSAVKRGRRRFSVSSEAEWSVAVRVRERKRGESMRRRVVRAGRRRERDEGMSGSS